MKVRILILELYRFVDCLTDINNIKNHNQSKKMLKP